MIKARRGEGKQEKRGERGGMQKQRIRGVDRLWIVLAWITDHQGRKCSSLHRNKEQWMIAAPYSEVKSVKNRNMETDRDEHVKTRGVYFYGPNLSQFSLVFRRSLLCFCHFLIPSAPLGQKYTSWDILSSPNIGSLCDWVYPEGENKPSRVPA